MPGPNDVTLVKNAIHNPNEPRHFMRITPAPGTPAASVGGTSIAESDAAVVVKEVGLDIYDAVVYFPRADVSMDHLVSIDKTTHCPLKGDTGYFDVVVGDQRLPESAWSYVGEMIAGEELQGRIAFDTTKVAVSS